MAGVLYTASIPTGTAMTTGVMDLSPFRHLKVVVDNTAGSVFRDLVFTSYLNDGTTQIDSVLIRKIGFGAAPDGSSYAPGNVRGYIGPNPPGGTSGAYVLFDKTGAADTAFNTGRLWVEDAEGVHAQASASAGTTTLAATAVTDDNAGLGQPQGVTPAAAQHIGSYWGPGVSVGTAAGVTQAIAGPLPRRLTYSVTTAGPGNTVRLVVTSRGRPPGTFAVQQLLPPKGVFSIASATSGTYRITIIGE